jgi:hypothetical protein
MVRHDIAAIWDLDTAKGAFTHREFIDNPYAPLPGPMLEDGR